ncbi:MAG TPA: ribose 5-phosphate isomerase B [Phycisphaerae bacterium]|nr:ribose 5-phosphate isomerase B [Phycisphaerae bacterium]
MKVAIACDHRGYAIKQKIAAQIADRGHEIVDFGTDGPKPCDYPDFAIPAAKAVAMGLADRGILIDGSGIGVSIIANKLPGVRAAICHDELTAEISRRHNNANVLCFAADLLGDELIRRIIDAWLLTPFEQGRHSRRVEKLASLEKQLFGSDADSVLRNVQVGESVGNMTEKGASGA